MERTIRTTRTALIAVTLAGALTGISPVLFAASPSASGHPQAASDNPAASDAAGLGVGGGEIVH